MLNILFETEHENSITKSEIFRLYLYEFYARIVYGSVSMVRDARFFSHLIF